MKQMHQKKRDGGTRFGKLWYMEQLAAITNGTKGLEPKIRQEFNNHQLDSRKGSMILTFGAFLLLDLFWLPILFYGSSSSTTMTLILEIILCVVTFGYNLALLVTYARFVGLVKHR